MTSRLSLGALLASAAFVSPALAQTQPEPAPSGPAPASAVSQSGQSGAAQLAPPQATTPQLATTPSGAAQPGTSANTATASPDAAEDDSDDSGDDIVVTGRRPRGTVVGDIPPENTLDAADIRATGATSINDLLDVLAPQIGSVRGRGGEQPIFLLNGQRISSFREIRDIPTEAIVRVEILPEEVSLKYGYDADQKVVNIVLRQRFRSTTVQAGAGFATEGGYGNDLADVTRFLVQKNGRTTINLHAEGNGMLTEAERNVSLNESGSSGSSDQDLADRTLVATKRDLRAGTTFNRQMFGNVSATLNTEVEHTDGLSFIGLNPNLLNPLARDTSNNTAHVGVTLNGQTKSQWRWTITSNGDLANSLTKTDQSDPDYPRERATETTESGDLTGNLNGNLLKLPGGYATTTLTVGGTTEHLSSRASRRDVVTNSDLSRTTGLGKINLDIPISRRGYDFSALGNLTINGNAEVQQLSDMGTLTSVGAGVNLTPIDRLNLLASWTREQGAPTINQLGDPEIETPGSRVFDFATGQTVLVNAITGGNPNLRPDRRNVIKLSGNWQPWSSTDLKFRVDYVHQTIAHPISDLTVTPGLEAAFPDRFVREDAAGQPCDAATPSCQLVSVDFRPLNFDSSTRDQLRIGFDFTHPLKSHQPSAAIIQQMREQFGFGPRGTAPIPGAAGAIGGPGGSSPSSNGTSSGAANGRPSGSFGGRGGRGGGLFGGGNRGRIMFDLTDTITFVDKVLVAPGGPVLNYLHGDATGSTGGTPRHDVQAQLSYFNNGVGARAVANWRSPTEVNSLDGNNLHFSSYGTFDLRLFANPGDIPEVVVNHPWLRGTQVQLNVTNIFDAKPLVRNAAGVVPDNYQPDLLDPLGRTVMITFRKLFLPSPAWFRRQFQQERQQQQQGAAPTR